MNVDVKLNTIHSTRKHTIVKYKIYEYIETIGTEIDPITEELEVLITRNLLSDRTSFYKNVADKDFIVAHCRNEASYYGTVIL